MPSKGRHPKKAIADALADLDRNVFSVEEIHRGHRWGRVVCKGCGESVAVFSTPRVPENIAAHIGQFALEHAGHRPTDEQEES